jgi:glycosyltransferase involved in cell wall biosynthesis
VIGREEQLAAIECMKLADEVTTTTDKLQLKLVHILRDMGEEKTPIVIPNAMDPEDNWPKIEDIGSPDGWQRMFWQGSATHGVDWEQCIEAVDNVMRKRTNLRMTILGFLPPVVQERLSMPHWKGRVEWMGFNAPETYFRLVRNIRAEVGLAHLRTSNFSAGKSCIKWQEYSLIGMPTVASDTSPYNDSINHERTGLLARNTKEWEDAITVCLDHAAERKRMVMEARKVIEQDFNIRNIANEWKDLLIG